MVAQHTATRDLLTEDALREALRPIERDYLAAIVLTADLPSAERQPAIRARRDAYLAALSAALASAVEASVWQVRGARPGGRS